MIENTVKPFLRWAGSKKKLLPILDSYWNNADRYLEPFVGSARFFFHINPQSAILGDINIDLINCYNVIKNKPLDLYRKIELIPRDKVTYYSVRDSDNTALNQVDQAARFIYLNRLCFNGLYRTNQKGKFNVPFGGLKAGNFPSKEDYLLLSKKLEQVEILNMDFEKLIVSNVKDGDFVYLDPPYAVKNKRIFRQYDPTNFGTEDLERLFSLLDYINSKSAKFLLSYAYCEELEEQANKWNSEIVITQRNIAGFACNRKKEKEFIISNIK